MKYEPANMSVKNTNNRGGVALVLVLFLVATVSILSLGFSIKADVALSCGQNVELRMDMEYLGLTAMNYAKAHVLNPQDVVTGMDGYWEGGDELQMESGGDYFDIQVTRSTVGMTPECTYDITCQAYRLEDEEKVSEMKLKGQLRLDPFIAYWSGDSDVVSPRVAVHGDVYCSGNMNNAGQIYGDVFTNSYLGSKTGQLKSLTEANVSWPGIDCSSLKSGYYIDGVLYKPEILSGNRYDDISWGPTDDNPAGIYYHEGNLDLKGEVNVNGTLVVTGGHLKFEDGEYSVDSVKNYPAIVCEGELQFKNAKGTINGLVQTYKTKVFKDGGDVTIVGGLFIKDGGIEVEDDYEDEILIRCDPMKTSIKLIYSDSNMLEWSAVGGAYFKSISRDESVDAVVVSGTKKAK